MTYNPVKYIAKHGPDSDLSFVLESRPDLRKNLHEHLPNLIETKNITKINIIFKYEIDINHVDNTNLIRSIVKKSKRDFVYECFPCYEHDIIKTSIAQHFSYAKTLPNMDIKKQLNDIINKQSILPWILTFHTRAEYGRMTGRRSQLSCCHFIKFLVDQGADPNKVDKDDNTFLMFCIVYDPSVSQIIQFLINICDLTKRNTNGKTALVLAAEQQFTDITDKLGKIPEDQNFVVAASKYPPISRMSGYLSFYRMKNFTSVQCWGSVIPKDIVNLIKKYCDSYWAMQ